MNIATWRFITVITAPYCRDGCQRNVGFCRDECYEIIVKIVVACMYMFIVRPLLHRLMLINPARNQKFTRKAGNSGRQSIGHEYTLKEISISTQ